MSYLTQFMLTAMVVSLLSTTLIGQNFPEVISVREIEMNENASGIHFHNDVIEMRQSLKKHAKGASVALLWGDRGERKNKMLHTWAFDLKANRDYYFPTADADDYAQLGALMEKMNVSINPNDDRVSGMDTYTDYVVIGYSSLHNPQAGEVVAMREFEVKDGKEAEFETFVNSTVHPAYQEHLEGMTAYVLKGDRGERNGKYLMVYCFDTYERRDSYFPKEGEGVSDAYEAASKDMPDFSDQMNAFVVEENPDSGTITYTDYIMIY